MKRHVYIFRGAPASGKGTVVPEIAKALPAPVALIEQDKLRWGIHLIGRSIPEIGPDEHRFAYENMRTLYESYLAAGRYTVVVEGLFTWDDEESSEGCAKELVEIARRYGFGATSIVLTAQKEELQKRNNQRPYAVPAEEFKQLYASVYSTIDESELVIDSTGLSASETTERLKQLLSL